MRAPFDFRQCLRLTRVHSVASKGKFIVRPSSVHGCLALSVKDETGVIHAVMSQTQRGWHVKLGDSVSSAFPTVLELLGSLQPYLQFDDARPMVRQSCGSSAVCATHVLRATAALWQLSPVE